LGVALDLSMSIFLSALIASVVSSEEEPKLNPNLFRLEAHLSSGNASKQRGLWDKPCEIDGDLVTAVSCSNAPSRFFQAVRFMDFCIVSSSAAEIPSALVLLRSLELRWREVPVSCVTPT
jgi:hypothetical protein